MTIPANAQRRRFLQGGLALIGATALAGLLPMTAVADQGLNVERAFKAIGPHAALALLQHEIDAVTEPKSRFRFASAAYAPIILAAFEQDTPKLDCLRCNPLRRLIDIALDTQLSEGCRRNAIRSLRAFPGFIERRGMFQSQATLDQFGYFDMLVSISIREAVERMSPSDVLAWEGRRSQFVDDFLAIRDEGEGRAIRRLAAACNSTTIGLKFQS